MKTSCLIAVTLIALTPQLSFGRIGETIRQSHERYGAPKTGRLNGVRPSSAVGYIYDVRGIRIEAVFEGSYSFSTDRCVALLFSRGRDGLSDDDTLGLLDANAVGKTWEKAATGLWVLSDKSVFAFEIDGMLMLTTREYFIRMRDELKKENRDRFRDF